MDLFAARRTDIQTTTSLYWIGLYETECSKKWVWFFQVDLTRAIRYGVLRFMGGGRWDLHLSLSPPLTQTNKNATVLGVLFAIQGILTITSLTSVPVFLFAHFLPGVSRDLWLGIYVVLTICVHLAWLRVSLFVACDHRQKS